MSDAHQLHSPIPVTAEIDQAWDNAKKGCLGTISRSLCKCLSDKAKADIMEDFELSFDLTFTSFSCFSQYVSDHVNKKAIAYFPDQTNKKAVVEKQKGSSTKDPSPQKNLKGPYSEKKEPQSNEIGQDDDEPQPSVANDQDVEGADPRVSTTKSSGIPPLVTTQRRRRNGYPSEPEVMEAQEERNTGSMPKEWESRPPRRSKRLAEKSRKQS